MYGGKFAFQNRLGYFIVGRKLTVFALFYFVFEGNFPSTSPRGSLYSEGRFHGGFFVLRVWVGGGGLIHGELIPFLKATLV